MGELSKLRSVNKEIVNLLFYFMKNNILCNGLVGVKCSSIMMMDGNLFWQ